MKEKMHLVLAMSLYWSFMSAQPKPLVEMLASNLSEEHPSELSEPDSSEDNLENLMHQLRIPTVATAWQRVGLEGEIPDYKNIVDVKLCSGKNSGKYNSKHLQQIIDKAHPGTVILLDSGVFRITDEINLKSGTVLRGQGAEFTRIYIENLPSAYRGVINFAGRHGRGTLITGGLEQGSTRITVSDNYGIPAGSTIMLTQLNDSVWMNTDNPEDWDMSWADRSVGQMVNIKEASHEVFELSEPVRYHDYKHSLEPKYYFVTKKVEYAGIEDLTLEMAPDTCDAGRFTVQFNLAENCWIKGVTLLNAKRGHLNIMHGRNLLVQNNIFKDAQQTGRGSGVDIGLRTSNCLIVHNNFYNLRQSVILQTGSNANVFANNIIKENDPANPCISIRGHWTYLNLFENNEADEIAVGNMWGPAGEGTTIFRNKIKKRLTVEDRSYHINIIGNEIANDAEMFIDPKAVEPYIRQNYSDVLPSNQGTDTIALPVSFYLLK
jgi:hypothetical protein